MQQVSINTFTLHIFQNNHFKNLILKTVAHQLYDHHSLTKTNLQNTCKKYLKEQMSNEEVEEGVNEIITNIPGLKISTKKVHNCG